VPGTIKVFLFLFSSAGTFPQLVITILKTIPSTKDTAKIVDWFFIALLPNYNMGSGISNLYTNYQYMDLCYNELPKWANRTAGKESLEAICDQYSSFVSIPCCKSEETLIYTLIFVNLLCSENMTEFSLQIKIPVRCYH